MVLTLIILTAFNIYMMFTNYKSKYIRWLFLIVVILSVTVVFLQIYISKYINYSHRFISSSTDFVFSLDHWLWERMSGFSVSAHTINRVINVSSAVFIYAVLVFSILYAKETMTKKTRILFILLAMLPLEITLFYDPLLSFQIFVRVSAGADANNSNTVLNLVKFLQILNYCAVNLYFFSALIILIRKYFKAKLKIKKNQILFIIAQILPLSLIFLLVFIWIPVKDVDIYTYSIRLSFTPSGFSIPYPFFEFLPVMAAGFLVIDIYLITRHQILYRMERQRNKTLRNRLREANENFQGVFHAFKNNFIAIKIMADRVSRNETDSDQKIKLGSDIGELCNEYIQKINILQSRLKKVKITFTEVDLVEMIKKLKQDIEEAYQINVGVVCQPDKVMMLADGLYLYEALRNFLVNSVEAVQSKTDKRIETQLEVESEWAIIRINDNGIGMSPKTIKELFKPFYSTKNVKNNWGIGLSYSKLIINAHGGDISVKSAENMYTSFEIVLPRVWR